MKALRKPTGAATPATPVAPVAPKGGAVAPKTTVATPLATQFPTEKEAVETAYKATVKAINEYQGWDQATKTNAIKELKAIAAAA